MKQLVILSFDTSLEEVFETAATNPLIAIKFGKITGLQEMSTPGTTRLTQFAISHCH